MNVPLNTTINLIFAVILLGCVVAYMSWEMWRVARYWEDNDSLFLRILSTLFKILVVLIGLLYLGWTIFMLSLPAFTDL